MENKYQDDFLVRTQRWCHADGSSSYSVFVMHRKGRSFVEAYVDDDGIFIGNLSVDPQFWRQGLGTATLDVLKDYICSYDSLSKTVEVESNSPCWMTAWYKRRGYNVICKI